MSLFGASSSIEYGGTAEINGCEISPAVCCKSGKQPENGVLLGATQHDIFRKARSVNRIDTMIKVLAG
jgi:hypothetical protein